MIHYDMEDLIDQANEIQESLGRSYGVPEEIDEADLQAGAFSPPRPFPLSSHSVRQASLNRTLTRQIVRLLLLQSSMHSQTSRTPRSSPRGPSRATCATQSRPCQTLWMQTL